MQRKAKKEEKAALDERKKNEGGSNNPKLVTASELSSVVEVLEERSLKLGMNSYGQLLRVLVIGLAFATRMRNLAIPKNVVFDEVHFGRFTTYFLKGTFFFDVHPPFTKLVFALTGYLSGFDGNFIFSDIGQNLEEILPHIWYQRLVPSIFSSLVIPCIYEILVDLGCCSWVAALGSFLVICDNMLVLQGRFMLIDPFLHFFVVFSIMAYLKFKNNSQRPFSFSWWMWLLCTGLGLVGAVSTKYSGIFVFLLIGGMTAFDLWTMIEDLTITPSLWAKHFGCRFFSLIVVPAVLYTLQFYILLSVLPNTGPQDEMMSSAFQASLKGGLAKITQGQAPVVAYGSQITLRHTHGKQCWLHSHSHIYPVKYPDDRGSSAQQQVTCYPFKDVNNWWIVKDPNNESLAVDHPPRPVKNGDIIQLVHGTTGRALNSHDVASPLSPQHQEVSCYIDYNISMATQNLWRLEIINSDNKAEWKALQSQIRLIHVNTSQAIKITGLQLPEWGFNQFEVCTDRIVRSDETVWNVEEHQQNITYPEGVDPEKEKEAFTELNNEKDNRVVHMPFFDKFKELQYKMISANKELQQEHSFSSRPQHWPLMKRGVAYWLDRDTNKQIFCIGNPLVWWPASLSIFVYFGFLGIYLLRRRRAVYDIDEGCWQKYVYSGVLLLGGYLLHYLPFFSIEHTLFLHQYLPALLFNILLLAFVSQHVLDIVSRVSIIHSFFCLVLVIYAFLVLWTFQYFSPFTYGDEDLSGEQIVQRKWLKSWDFLVHR